MWEGYFEYLLSACYSQDFEAGGLMESYYNHDGFYDTSPWKINNLQMVLNELSNFKKEKIDTNSPDIINTVARLKDELISFLQIPLLEEKEVYIEYN